MGAGCKLRVEGSGGGGGGRGHLRGNEVRPIRDALGVVRAVHTLERLGLRV